MDELEPYPMIPQSAGSKLFGSIMQILRKRNRLRGAEIAERCGISVAYVSMIENGNRVPSLELAMKILDCFPDNFGIKWAPSKGVDLSIREEEEGVWIDFEFISRIKAARRKAEDIGSRRSDDFNRIERLRLECLEIAQQNTFLTTSEVIARAKEFEAYIKGV